MTPERLLGWIAVLILVVLAIWVLFVVVDKIDDEDEPGYVAPSALIRE